MEERRDKITPLLRAEEAALELAAWRLLQQQQEEAERALSDAQKAEADSWAREARAAVLDRAGAALAGRSPARRAGPRTPRWLRAAAAALLLFYIGSSVALAASPQVRASFIGLMTRMNESYLEIRFEEIGSPVDIPEGWWADYYPTYIPEGFEIVPEETLLVQGLGSAIYASADGQRLRVEMLGATASMNLNVEGADISHTTVNGLEAMILRQPYGNTDVLYTLGNVVVHISTTAGEETALRVARSVSIIKK